MREIKFRAWDKGTDGAEPQGMSYDQEFCHVMIRNNDGFEVMQFTGLLDKNGKKIYEGDLLKKKDADKPRVVKWTDQNGAYFVLSNSATKKVDWDDCLTDEHIKIFEYEVIGDTYSNPELLN